MTEDINYYKTEDFLDMYMHIKVSDQPFDG